MFTPTMSRGETTVRGLLAVVLGAVLVAWPSITIGTVVALFAIFAFADAIVSSIELFRSGEGTADRVQLGLRALIEVIVAGVAIAYPGVTASIMTVVIGVFAIAFGVNELAAGRRLSRLGLNGTGWAVVSGVLSVMTGVALVVWPGIGAVTLAIVFGLYLAILGLTLLVSAAITPRGQRVVTPEA
jgi:uncharacterized membrane protein HdeD (DUF308 family)